MIAKLEHVLGSSTILAQITKGKAKIDQKPKLGYALTNLSSKLALH